MQGSRGPWCLAKLLRAGLLLFKSTGQNFRIVKWERSDLPVKGEGCDFPGCWVSRRQKRLPGPKQGCSLPFMSALVESRPPAQPLESKKGLMSQSGKGAPKPVGFHPVEERVEEYPYG